MRNKSIFGPIFLILLGLVLLIHNLNPRFSALELFANYWPWILVFWGSFRLIESAITRSMGRPRPEPLGPAALVVALLLCLTGSTAHAIVGNHGDFFEWFFERGGHFHLRHRSGNIYHGVILGPPNPSKSASSLPSCISSGHSAREMS